MGAVAVLLVVTIGLALALVAPRLVWAARFPFIGLQRAMLWLELPHERLMRDPDGRLGRVLHLGGLPLLVLYWLALWVLLMPLRAVDAAYYDLVLFWSCALRDQLADLLLPKADGYRHVRGLRYLVRWATGLPMRIWDLGAGSFGLVVQGLVMFVTSTVLPTLSLYHGTSYEQAATRVLRTNRWFVGQGAYASAGIYFGHEQRVADHYARLAVQRVGGRPGVVVTRVTLFPCLPLAAARKSTRDRIGGADSAEIGRDVGKIWPAIRHWRKDLGWWEYCLVQPGQMGRFVRSWRIRPICAIQDGRPVRVWKGLAFWPATLGSATVAGICLVLFILVGVPVLVTL